MPIWILYALLAAVFAALVAIFGKIGIAGIDPTLATTVRAIIMATFLAIVTLLSGKWQTVSTISGKLLFFIALSGIAGALSWLFYFVALKYGPASGVAALDRLSVVFVVVFAALFLAEALTLKVAIGAILITIGALFMVF
ncbi:MAG: EamA family transporter [Candidatus Pacebacteria bacterium]|jgi:transporter family protein|nr:EamA family transporter [Candidatus Paceibacterota bacterium]MDD3072161.1 EamA family transporter [Candidatus Paceibacterota bacterium]MDD3728774.1 EamA family transporter [Candidatus Paceibacterota bacterium]MDD4201367.1 EamA family transporter [Candidatus Paceibacterota bacterium]MDD4466924.1 EamA family transporter [Candidatus Paceibacterota bacterium]